MAETSVTVRRSRGAMPTGGSSEPGRADRRVALLGVLVACWRALALIDGVIALIGTGRFGDASGWLATILPALIFFDDLRAWAGYGVRFLVARRGRRRSGSASAWSRPAWRAACRPMLSGALGALVAVHVYAVVWFFGIRWLTGRGAGEECTIMGPGVKYTLARLGHLRRVRRCRRCSCCQREMNPLLKLMIALLVSAAAVVLPAPRHAGRGGPAMAESAQRKADERQRLRSALAGEDDGEADRT